MNFIALVSVCVTALVVNAQEYPNQIEDPCNGRNQGFARDLRSCNHYFYCENGRGHRGVCASNRLFDGEREFCVTANNSPCFRCSADRSYHLTSVPRACHQYIQCYNNTPTLHTCPANLVFDGRSGIAQCNIPPPTGGCYRENNTEIEERCPTETDRPVYLRHATDCAVYFVCSGSATPQRGECPNGLHFNLRLGVCDHPSNAQCQNDPPPTPPTTQPGPATRCERNGQFVPDRTRCTFYHICVSNGTVERECGGVLVFDHVSRACTLPENGRCWANENQYQTDDAIDTNLSLNEEAENN